MGRRGGHKGHSRDRPRREGRKKPDLEAQRLKRLARRDKRAAKGKKDREYILDLG